MKIVLTDYLGNDEASRIEEATYQLESEVELKFAMFRDQSNELFAVVSTIWREHKNLVKEVLSVQSLPSSALEGAGKVFYFPRHGLDVEWGSISTLSTYGKEEPTEHAKEILLEFRTALASLLSLTASTREI